jgi:hypothetical protein
MRTTPTDLTQVIVMDAGSSGTRIHCYNFHWHKNNNVFIPKIDRDVIEQQTLRVEPGLSSLANLNDMKMSNTIETTITSLLTFAKQFVTTERLSQTPVLLKATAGMRLVNVRTASKIMNEVRQQLLESDFLFEADWASIIPGEEEAGLAWIAANYLNGTLDTVGTPTLGVIEMGGASSQISFSIGTDGTSKAMYQTLEKDHRFKFTDFYQREHYIYAMSYLGFGRDSAYARLDATLANRANTVANAQNEVATTTTLTNPCHLHSYSHKITLESGPSVLVQGSGNYNQCLTLIKHVLFNATVTDQPPYIPGTVLDQGALSPIKNNHAVPMIATEVFYYVRENVQSPQIQQSLQHHLMDLSPTYTEMLGNLVCSSGSGENNQHQERDDTCFSIGFQSIFLNRIGALSSDSATKKMPTPKAIQNIGGVQVEWAIGAAVQYAVTYDPHSSSSFSTLSIKTTSSYWSFSETIFFALAITFATLSFLVVLAKMVSSTHCLSNLGRHVFNLTGGHGARRRTQGRRNKNGDKFKNSDVKKRKQFTKYERVQTEEDNDDATSRIEIEMNNSSGGGSRTARGPVALKWKLSDDHIAT